MSELVPPTESEVKWAAKTIYGLSNTPATQKEINMFWDDPHGSSRYIKAIIAKAQPQTGGGNGNAYIKAIDILTAYGIDCYRQPR
jgi:hypothetical protein